MDLPDLSPKSQPLEAALSKELRGALHEALMRLPEQMRKCMILRVYHELSYKELAVVMGISVETVKAHLHQARAKMKVSLAPYYGEPGI